VFAVEKPKEKTPLGRPRHRWEDNIKSVLKEVEWECVDCVDLALKINSYYRSTLCSL
jgi:hypothetical protein